MKRNYVSAAAPCNQATKSRYYVDNQSRIGVVPVFGVEPSKNLLEPTVRLELTTCRLRIDCDHS